MPRDTLRKMFDDRNNLYEDLQVLNFENNEGYPPAPIFVTGGLVFSSVPGELNQSLPNNVNNHRSKRHICSITNGSINFK